uniref:erythromycin esterase family protein n=1 Tax=Streptomyces phytophilus TaxID=722715 RepID=UPI00215D8845
PVGDLRPIVAAIGDAEVAGVGEATHNSRQFFTFRDRLFRHLAEKKGYRTFVLETNWSAGVRIDAYIRGGEGDIRRIMREEFQNSYRLWNTREYLDLFAWMRAYNQRHDRQIRFVGNDIALAGPVLFDKVTSYVHDRHPDLLPEVARLYAGQRPEGSVDEAMEKYMGLPLAERRDMHRRAGAAYELLRDRRPAGGGAAYELALQHARVIAQVARMYAFDFDDPVLVAGHNAHLSYEPIDPEQFPTTAGAVLRERLGGRYVSLRTTFDRGSFNAIGAGGELGTFTVGPAPAGSNEYLLDQVPYRDFALDLRTVGEPARGWLTEEPPG